MAPVSVIVTLLTIVLAPVLPVFARDELGPCDNNGHECVGPRLPSWLSWFMTPDNSLYGDETFERINGRSYWSQVKWLWRNPGYGFGVRYLKAPYATSLAGDPTIRDNDRARAGWCLARANGLFQFKWIQPIGFQRCIYCNFGWNIMGLVDPGVPTKPNPWEATFAFSPRISGFR